MRLAPARLSGAMVALLTAFTLAACGGSSGSAAAAGAAAAQAAVAQAAVAQSAGDVSVAPQAPATTAALAVTNQKGRFVNMALDPATGTGIAVDIYLGTVNPASTVNVGDKLSAVDPAPTKWVTNLAFGSATSYIGVPVIADSYVTRAGDTTILSSQEGGDEVFNDDGDSDSTDKGKPLQDTYVISGGFDKTSNAELQVSGMHEPFDFQEDDGQDLPIAGKAVLIASMSGTPSVDDSVNAGASERQLGIVGAASCLPEEHGSELGSHDSYMNVGTTTPVEYVVDPGQVTIGTWETGDTAVCKGSPLGTVSAPVTAGARYYVFGYGPALSPKFLVLSIPAPTSGKTATPTSVSADG